MKEVFSKALAFGTELLFSRVATDLFSQQWTYYTCYVELYTTKHLGDIILL